MEIRNLGGTQPNEEGMRNVPGRTNCHVWKELVGFEGTRGSWYSCQGMKRIRKSGEEVILEVWLREDAGLGFGNRDRKKG